jgi:hypothetical protein
VFELVVVGVDFGRSGLAAIALARRLVAPAGRLLLTNVVMSDPMVFGGKSAATLSGELALADALLERERRVLELERRRSGWGDGIEVELCCVPAASTGRGLGFVAQRRGADLIVAGAPAPGLRRRVLGGGDLGGVPRRAPDGIAIAIAPEGYAGGDRPQTVNVVDDDDPDGGRALDVARWLAKVHDAGLVRTDARELASMGGEGDLLVTSRRFLSRRRRRLSIAGCPVLAVSALVNVPDLTRSG